MKRIFILLLCAVSCFLTAMATSHITLTETEGRPGDEVTVRVGLDGPDQVTAMEILVPLDPLFTYVDGSAQFLGDRKQDHELSAAVVNGQLRLYIYSLSLLPLKGQKGDLVEFRLKLGPKPLDFKLDPKVLLSDASGHEIPVQVTPGKVKILARQLKLDHSVLDFGRLSIQKEYTGTFQIINSGTETVEIKDIVSDRAEVTPTWNCKNIAPGKSENVTLTFVPTQTGEWQSEIKVYSDAANEMLTLQLKALLYSINELRVKPAKGVSNEDIDIVLHMNNMEPIVGLQCDFVLPEGLEYVPNSFTVASRAIDHIAKSTQTGKTVTLFVYSPSNEPVGGNEGEIGRFKVRQCGTVPLTSYIEPAKVILSNQEAQNVVSASYGAYLTWLSPEFIGKNNLSLGEGAFDKPLVAHYEVSNNGDLDLTVDRVTFLDDGYQVRSALPLVIPPSETRELEIAYQSQYLGEFSTKMNLYTNDPAHRMETIDVHGKLFEPNQITLSGENLQNGDYRWTIGLDNYADVVAFQMDIHWLPDMRTGLEQLQLLERLQGYSYTLAQIDGETVRLVVYSMHNQVIPGKSGDLLTLTYHPANGVAFKDSPVLVDHIVLSNVKSENVASAVSFKAIAAYNHFNVRFLVDDEVFAEKFLKVGDRIILPEGQPRKEGLAFVGWGDVADVMPAENVDYYAQFRGLLPIFTGDSSLDLGSGTLSDVLSVPYVITNRGEIPLVINSANVDHPCFNISSSLPLTLAPGESKSLQLSYVGVEPGEVNGTLTLTTNEPEDSVHQVQLTAGLTDDSQLDLSGDNSENGDYSWTVSLSNLKDLKSVQMDLFWLADMEAYGDLLELTERTEGCVAEVIPLGDGYTRIKLSAQPGQSIHAGQGQLFKLTYHQLYPTQFRDTEARLENLIWSVDDNRNLFSSAEASAQATFNHFTVRFLVDGEVFEQAFLKVGDPILLPENNPVKQNHVFENWGDVAERMPASDVDYVAHFRTLYPKLQGEQSIDFGTGTLGKTLLATYELTNIGKSVLEINGADFEGTGFELLTELPIQVSSDEICTLTFAYTGLEAGPTVGMLTFVTNEPQQSDTPIQLYADVEEHNQVSLTGANTDNGEYEWTVSLSNEVPMLGIEMDLHWLPSIKVSDESIHLSTRLPGWTTQVTSEGDGVTHVSLKAPGHMALKPGSGPVFTLAYKTGTVSEYKGTEAHLNHLTWNSENVEGFLSAAEATAVAEVNHFTVRFLIAGKVYEEYFLEVGEPIPVPENPMIEGYDFEGWGDVLDVMPDHDVDYEAILISTGIASVFEGTPYVDVYDLNGRKLKTQVPVSELKNELPAGVYIVNGKKVLFR